MKLKNYYYNLTNEQQAAFAKKLDTTREYIRVHLIPRHRKPDRTPPLSKIKKIPKATRNKVSFQEVINHFSEE